MILDVTATRYPLEALALACEAAYPREACGWITGDRVHAARPGTRESFQIDGDDLLAMIADRPRALFHSHPDGDDVMSARDRELLALHPLPHLIVAVTAGRARVATLHLLRDHAHVIAARYVRSSGSRCSDLWKRCDHDCLEPRSVSLP